MGNSIGQSLNSDTKGWIGRRLPYNLFKNGMKFRGWWLVKSVEHCKWNFDHKKKISLAILKFWKSSNLMSFIRWKKRTFGIPWFVENAKTGKIQKFVNWKNSNHQNLFYIVFWWISNKPWIPYNGMASFSRILVFVILNYRKNINNNYIGFLYSNNYEGSRKNIKW